MPDFKPTEDIISMSEFRNTLADCAARTRETHRPIFLTQNGRASAVFLDAADWEKIAEKLYNACLYEDILASEGESERGETYSTDEVRSMIDADLKKLTRTSKGKHSAKKHFRPETSRLPHAIRERTKLRTSAQCKSA